MKLRSLLFAFATLVYAGKANAQHDFKKIDAWLDTHTSEMGGRSYLMIYQNGQVVYSHGVSQMGRIQKAINQMAAQKQGKTADLSDYTATKRQPIASCSKWLSAALVMTFVDEGKLKLSDTVGTYLPILSKNGKGGITIAQCLSHQTGIKTPPLKESLQEMRGENSMDDAMADIAKLDMEGQPGKTFHYSNAGLQIAGAIIEKISSKSFETLFAERIAKPLGLKNTDFDHAKVALPAGGAYSTAEDYLNFLVMILNKGTYNGKRVLSENAIREMQINRITADVKVAYSPAEAGDTGYGYGEWVYKDALNTPSAVVSSPGLFGSYPVIDNKNKYAAFLITFYINSKGRQARYAELKQLIDESLK
jgi:CubicO group peptidase (beta-lactamase class C family)